MLAEQQESRQPLRELSGNFKKQDTTLQSYAQTFNDVAYTKKSQPQQKRHPQQTPWSFSSGTLSGTPTSSHLVHITNKPVKKSSSKNSAGKIESRKPHKSVKPIFPLFDFSKVRRAVTDQEKQQQSATSTSPQSAYVVQSDDAFLTPQIVPQISYDTATQPQTMGMSPVNDVQQQTQQTPLITNDLIPLEQTLQSTIVQQTSIDNSNNNEELPLERKEEIDLLNYKNDVNRLATAPQQQVLEGTVQNLATNNVPPPPALVKPPLKLEDIAAFLHMVSSYQQKQHGYNTQQQSLFPQTLVANQSQTEAWAAWNSYGGASDFHNSGSRWSPVGLPKTVSRQQPQHLPLSSLHTTTPTYQHTEHDSYPNYCNKTEFPDETLWQKFQLKRSSKFVFYPNCSQIFYQCANARAFINRCPSPEQAFDPALPGCNFRHSVLSCPDYDHVMHCSIRAQCTEEQFACCARPQRCIELWRRCDGHQDCSDGDDENNCLSCRRDEFACVKSNKCIPASKRCDGILDDCGDGSNLDEVGCRRNETCLGKFACESPKTLAILGHSSCVELSAYCDGKVDCPGDEDEYNCLNVSGNSDDPLAGENFIPPSEKPHLYLTCENLKETVAQERWCNGRNDCSDGSDEKHCF